MNNNEFTVILSLIFWKLVLFIFMRLMEIC